VRRDRRRQGGAIALVLCLLGQAAGAAEPQPDLELKAAYLARLAPFVLWPTSLFAQPSEPLVLCVQGDDPFGGKLDQLTAGEGVGSHPIIVRRLARLDADSGCQIAYLGGSAAQSQAAALHTLDGQPVLTVTDGDVDGGGKGMVCFVRIAGRVRFVIDAGRATQSGLVISSKLLALAADVKR
jgi:hypothetical protein